MMTLVGDSTFSTSRTAGWRRRAWWLVVPVCLAAIASCGQAKTNVSATDALNAGLKAQVQGRTDEAIKDYQLVLAKDPHNKYAFYNLGLIDHLAGRIDSAEKNYRTALQTDPNFAPALYNLAILRTTPSPQEAVDLYRHVINQMPGYAAAHLNLGFLLISLHQMEEGRSELDRAVVLDPSLTARVKASLPAPTPSPSPAKKR